MTRSETESVSCFSVPGGKLLVAPASELRDAISAWVASLPRRARRMSLWHTPGDLRQRWLNDMCAAAALGGLLLLNGRAAAAALVAPCAPGAATAHIHLMATPTGANRADLVLGCRRFVDMALEKYAAITCAIPRHWRGARDLAAAIGFERLAVLPGAALAYGADDEARLVDMVFYCRKRG